MTDSSSPARSALQDFDALVAEHWSRVFRFAYASLRDRGEAESVAQDCFLRAWQKRESYRGEAAAGTWVMRIAVNLVRDRVRNRRFLFWRNFAPETTEASADPGSSVEASLAARQQMLRVRNVAATLPERQRTVFLLRFVEDMELSEIAVATGLREGTVKAHLFRALQAVRRGVEK